MTINSNSNNYTVSLTGKSASIQNTTAKMVGAELRLCDDGSVVFNPYDQETVDYPIQCYFDFNSVNDLREYAQALIAVADLLDQM